MGIPLLFIVACAELVAGDDSSGVHDCRLKVEKVEKVERAARPASGEHPGKVEHATPAADHKAAPAPAAPEPVRCDEGELPGELWDGTGRSEAVRGA